ncbi:mismatch repair protein MSH8 [Angomonas deanei]|nr:mismatch repair protein MSH8 [Angomonas deanei]|eukprot:EPY29879.1 mismatch repair protein MSH8 [Angomonas deanei]
MKESDEPVVGKQKVVPRKLVEIITPGTVVDLSMISDHNEIFLLALCPVFVDQKRIVIDAFAVDMSRRVVHSCPCGKSDDLALLKEGKVSREISVSPLPDLPHTSLEPLTSLLQQLNPKEIIIPQLTDSKVNMYYCGKIAEWVAADGFKVGFFENTKNNVQLPPHFPQYSPGVPCAATVAFHYLLALHHDKDELGFLAEASEYVAHLNTQVKKEQFTSGDAVRSRTLEYERKYDMGLILDSSTVTNLEIVKNLQDGSEVGSLNALLNFCTTNGGRRLFRSWLLRPARTPKVIGDRLECVRFFLDHHFSEEWCSEDSGPSQSRKRQRESEENTLRCNFSAIMSIDFERILSRISAIKAESSSSISYVDPMVVYRRDLNLILLTVKSFVNLISWGSWFKKRLEELKVKLPTLLTELVDTILACQTSVEAISKLFDREAAETTGQLTPSFGTCPEYDDSVSRLNALEEKLHAARRKAQAELFGGAEVSFADLGKDIFLYEVSTSSAPKLTPKGLVERSRNAKTVRYIDSSLSSVVEAHKVAASAKASGLLGVLQKVAARICDYNTSLYEAAAALSYLDCLLNLSDLPRRWPSSHFPQLMECGDASAIQGENLVHPLMKVSTSSTPVPNSVTLDNSRGRVLVLTGPNMAGKSTLMRTLR